MEYYNIILNMCLLFTVFLVSYPNEVKGFKMMADYNPTRGLYKYPWRSFNPEKRTETDDGAVLVEGGAKTPDENKIEIYTNELVTKASEVLTTNEKKSSGMKMPLHNNVQRDYEIEVLYDRVPGTFVFWPSAED